MRRDGLEHVIVVDRTARGAPHDRRLEAVGDDFDFEAAWRAVEPDDVLTLIYTSGTTGPPKGVQLTHGNMMAVVTRSTSVDFPRGAVVSFLPMAHIAERWVQPLPPDALRLHHHCCPDPREVVAYLPEVKPTWSGRFPASGRSSRRRIEAGVAAEQDAGQKQATEWALEVGLQEGPARAGGQGGPSRARRGACEGRRAGAVEDPLAPGARRGRIRQRRRRAHAARGDRVLPRDRDPAGRAVGHVRDLRVRHLQPARRGSRSAPWAPCRPAPRSSSPTTARCSSAARSSCPATATSRRRRARPSTPRGGSTRATWASSTTTAT